MKRLHQLRNDFEAAFRRLKEAAEEAETPLEVDGTIQRFEFTFELCWKFIRSYLMKEGIECNSPRSCLKEAYKMKLIGDERLWLQMLSDRNRSVHIYDEEISREIFDRIKKDYIEAFGNVLGKIKPEEA